MPGCDLVFFPLKCVELFEAVDQYFLIKPRKKFQLQSCIMAIFSFKLLRICTCIFRFLKDLSAIFNIAVISGSIFYCLFLLLLLLLWITFSCFFSCQIIAFCYEIVGMLWLRAWNFCVCVPLQRLLSFVLVGSYFTGWLPLSC